MSKKLGPIAVFLVTACLSFFITKELIVNPLPDPLVPKEKESETDISTDVPSDEEATTTPATTVTTTPERMKVDTKSTTQQAEIQQTESQLKVNQQIDTPQEPEPKPVPTKPIKLKASKRVLKDNTYSFKASIDGTPTESYHFELTKDGTVAYKSDDGNFPNVSPIQKNEKYELHVVGESAGDLAPSIPITDCIDKTIRLITKEEFQTRMLNLQDHSLDGGRNKKKTFVTDDFKVVVINTNKEIDGEYEVSDVQDVKGMIHTYNKWKGARVVELEYDAKGYVKLAKIEAIY